MSSTAASPVSPQVVQAALRTTTETLARELARPSERAPSWSEFEWRTARAAAAIHGVSPLLATTLRWRGPQGWQTFLTEQRAHTQSRHERIEALGRSLQKRAREAQLPLVALKGAALHHLGLYAPGERPMADLDFLVAEADMAAAGRVLEEHRYGEALCYWKNRVFSPTSARVINGLGEHRDNVIKVELHWRIREKLPIDLTDISQQVFPGDPRPGLNAYPSTAALLTHLVLHAAGSMASRELRLIHLHDLALVCARMTPEDWRAILWRGPQGLGPWWFLPPLRLAQRYYADIVPNPVMLRLEAGCPMWLRRRTANQTLTDVSLSSVWIRAFPGIEWSRTPGEAARLMLGRLRPSAEDRTIRKSDAATAPWASHGGWKQLSQRSRLLRWLVTRPPRPATMYVMRESLRQPLPGDFPAEVTTPDLRTSAGIACQTHGR